MFIELTIVTALFFFLTKIKTFDLKLTNVIIRAMKVLD